MIRFRTQDEAQRKKKKNDLPLKLITAGAQVKLSTTRAKWTTTRPVIRIRYSL